MNLQGIYFRLEICDKFWHLQDWALSSRIRRCRFASCVCFSFPTDRRTPKRRARNSAQRDRFTNTPLAPTPAIRMKLFASQVCKRSDNFCFLQHLPIAHSPKLTQRTFLESRGSGQQKLNRALCIFSRQVGRSLRPRAGVRPKSSLTCSRNSPTAT